MFVSNIIFGEKVFEGNSCDFSNESFSFLADTRTKEFIISNIRGAPDAEWIAILNPWRIIESTEYRIWARTNFRSVLEKAGVTDRVLLYGSSLVTVDWDVDLVSKQAWVYIKVDPSYFNNQNDRRSVDRFIRETQLISPIIDERNILSVMYSCRSINVSRDYLDEENKRLAIEKEEERQKELNKIPTLVSSGTGFFINEKGYIVTNYHVVDGCKYIEHNSTNLELVLTDPVNDLAVLKSSSIKNSALVQSDTSWLIVV